MAKHYKHKDDKLVVRKDMLSRTYDAARALELVMDRLDDRFIHYRLQELDNPPQVRIELNTVGKDRESKLYSDVVEAMTPVFESHGLRIWKMMVLPEPREGWTTTRLMYIQVAP